MLAVAGCAGRQAGTAGAGIQGAPVRLAALAQPGHSYALPPVYIVNTGSGTETMGISALRGGRIPLSWIRSAPVVLGAGQSARVRVTLVVPPGAAPGRYRGYIVAGETTGSGPQGSGIGVSLGAAAGTGLLFRVGAR